MTTLTSNRYPGWQFTKISNEGYTGKKDGCVYAVSVMFSQKFGWTAELLTYQKHLSGSKCWNVPRSDRQFEGTPAECIAEAERRNDYIQRKNIEASSR